MKNPTNAERVATPHVIRAMVAALVDVLDPWLADPLAPRPLKDLQLRAAIAAWLG